MRFLRFVLCTFVILAVAERKDNETTTCDVLILGAGLAGTSAGWRLVGERPADIPIPKVCILEASNRTGGRTKDHVVEGCSRPQTVELGAQWIAQKEIDADVWDLAVNVLGLGIYNGWPWALYGFPYGPARVDPKVKNILDQVMPASSPEYDGGRMFFGPNVSDSDPKVGRCKKHVASVYDSIVLGRPWLTPDASMLDALTPLEWMNKVGCNITKEDIVAQGLNQVDLSDPKNLPPAFYLSMTSAGSSSQEIFWESSALWWLHNVKSNSGPVSMTVDVQNYRIVGGPQQMSERLAQKLRTLGALVELNAPVHTIHYGDSSVEFITKAGKRYEGRYAIITGNPVSLSTHISWQPQLPVGVHGMLRSAHIGNYNKHYAFFKEGPVWRDDPEMWSEIQKRTVQWPMVFAALPPLPPDSQQMPNGTAFFPSPIVDNSPVTVDTGDEACPKGAGALFSFGWPQNGSTAAERAEGWYSLLKDVPRLPKPSSVIGQAWAEEPYIMGAYGAWWPPGVLSTAKEQWKTVPGGRVFFAGTEWSAVGAGYMNGAIHNGRAHGTHVSSLLHGESRVTQLVV